MAHYAEIEDHSELFPPSVAIETSLKIGHSLNTRILVTILAICYGGASLCAALAVLGFVRGGQFGTWGLVLSAVLLATVGVLTQNTLRESDDLLARAQSQLELLNAEMDQRQNAVDVLADGLETGIFICDTRATILYANQRASDMFRFENPEGRSLLAVTISHDLEQQVFDCFRENRSITKEQTLSHPSDRVGICKVWPEGEGKRAFVSIYEITDLRRLERIRQDFVSNVSHELRTPLTIIRAKAEMLIEDPKVSQAERERHLFAITEEVDRLTNITADLLTLSASESRRVEKTPVDIAKLTHETVARLTPKAEEKGLSLGFQGPKSLVAEVNEIQYSQIVLNLVDNALNYTSEGSVSVSLRATDQEAILEVADTGIGIASEHLPRIFERFYRVDKGRSRATGGTGLGLSIVKHIVDAHGGKVTVDSSLNQGSRFTVLLPLTSQ